MDKVYECAAFYRLKRLLEDGGFTPYDPALARTAAVLSRIRLDRDGARFGILLFEKGIKYEQVKRLVKTHDLDRLLLEFAHLVDRLSGEAPVVGVADVTYWWEVGKSNREFFYDFFLKEGA
jgi:hypothetical protein